jgi:hypothetical protein
VAAVAAVTATAAANGRPSSATGQRCRRAPPTTAPSLPAAVIVTTSCGRFRLDRSGRVAYLGPRTLPVPRKALSYWPDLTWYSFERGHLLIGRGHRQLWRSRRSYARAKPVNIGAVVLGAHELAFTYFDGLRPLLYVARYRSAERLLVRGETPLTFFRSGELLTWRDRNRALLLRSKGGRLERLLVSHASDAAVDRRTGALVFRAGDRLGVVDGGRVRELGGLRGFGIKGWPVIEPLGRLVSVHDRNRLVVVEYDGRMVASTPLPRRRQPADGISSSVVANARGTTFAFTATQGNTAYGSSGQETVYVVGAGERQARPIFDEQLDFEVCERMAELAWRGDWLLYGDTEGHAAIVDTSLTTGPIDLSGFISRLPGLRSGGDNFFEIHWSART